MNFLGKLALFCVLMALFQKALEVLAVGLAVVWIYGFIVKPTETIGFVCLLTMAACMRTYPGWSLISLVVIIATICICNAKSRESGL